MSEEKMRNSIFGASWRYRSLPGWYGNAEHAAPMHQDFEAYEIEAELAEEIRVACEEGRRIRIMFEGMRGLQGRIR